MALKKIKLSKLPWADSLKGLIGLGVDGAGKSVKVDLEKVQIAADKANSEANSAKTATEKANAATEKAKEASANPTYIGKDYFVYVYDLESKKYIKTDINVKGPKGDPGVGGGVGGGSVLFYASVEERDADLPSLPVGSITVVLEASEGEVPVNGGSIQVLDFNTDYTPNLYAYDSIFTGGNGESYLCLFGLAEESGSVEAVLIMIALTADGTPASPDAGGTERAMFLGVADETGGLSTLHPIYSTVAMTIPIPDNPIVSHKGWNTTRYDFGKPVPVQFDPAMWTDVELWFNGGTKKRAVSVVAEGGALVDNTAPKVVQTTGNSETKVMSQKAVTQALAALSGGEATEAFNICQYDQSFPVVMLFSAHTYESLFTNQNEISTYLRYHDLVEAIKMGRRIVARAMNDEFFCTIDITAQLYICPKSASNEFGFVEGIVLECTLPFGGWYGLADNQRVTHIIGKKADGTLLWVMRNHDKKSEAQA